MGKISKILLNSLFVASATAENIQVTGCNDETLDVSCTINNLPYKIISLNNHRLDFRIGHRSYHSRSLRNILTII